MMDGKNVEMTPERKRSLARFFFDSSKRDYKRSMDTEGEIESLLDLSGDEIGILFDELFNDEEGTFDSFMEKIKR